MNPALTAQGRTIFRFDAHGDETFWTDTLRMHEVIRTSVSPATALAVGREVGVDAPPNARWHPPQLMGPHFHDGTAATLDAVAEHHAQLRGLDLTAHQKRDPVEYLESL